MFANVECRYFIGELPDTDTKGDGESNAEQTQSYDFVDGGDTGEEKDAGYYELVLHSD